MGFLSLSTPNICLLRLKQHQRKRVDGPFYNNSKVGGCFQHLFPDSSNIGLVCYTWNHVKLCGYYHLHSQSSASQTEVSLSLSLSFCLPGQQQISHSHNGAATILGQTPVLHLKAYLTFHSSIHRLQTLRLWARPRLASGRQCSELKATHGSSLVLWVTKHTSRARNSWPVFLTHKEKPGI